MVSVAFEGLHHVAVIFAFLLGIAALAVFDHPAVPTSYEVVPNDVATSSQVPAKRGFWFCSSFPVTVAAVMGIHGLGESLDLAGVAGVSGSTDNVTAIGG